VKLRVGIGVSSLPAASAREFFAWAELCEASEIDSIWQTDRLISQQPFLESLSVMASLAGATERVKFGMNAVVAPLRDPLVLAKQCATIDWLSGGRLLPVFGVGGEHAAEFRATGRNASERGRRADEVLEIARRLWSEDSVTFHGEFHHFEGVSILPRPIQRPLPLWIGGSSAAAIRRTVRLGTGWLGRVQSPAQVAPVVAAIKKLGHESGRPVPDDHFGASFVFRLGPQDDALLERVSRGYAAAARASGGEFDPKAYFALGDADAVLERVAQYRATGVSKFVLLPLARNGEELLEQTRRLAAEVVPIAHGWD